MINIIIEDDPSILLKLQKENYLKTTSDNKVLVSEALKV